MGCRRHPELLSEIQTGKQVSTIFGFLILHLLKILLSLKSFALLYL